MVLDKTVHLRINGFLKKLTNTSSKENYAARTKMKSLWIPKNDGLRM